MQVARPDTHGAEDSDGREHPPTRFYLVGLIVLVLAAVPYAVGVLLPYFANDLHRLPLAEVASGAHDPKDMWPQHDNALPGLVQLAGLVAVLLGPVLTLAVLAAASWKLWLGQTTSRGARVVGYVTALLALAMTAGMLSPGGLALATWRLD